jgi:tetratricopeptide (TPR) repeat protein
MKTFSLLLLALATAVLPLKAGTVTLDDGNAAFATGKYHDATQAYQAVLAERGYSAPVLYNLGNSLYHEGKIGEAILAYKRAQWLAPHDADIAANLALAQQQAGVAVAGPRWYDKVAGMLSASGWAWLACATWTLFCLSLLARRIAPQAKSLLSLLATADAFVLAIAIAAAVLTSGGLNEAVVIDKNASALISPFPAAQTVFSPAPGETVTVQKAYNDFLLVADRAGHSGWINKSQVTPVVPES